MKKIENVIIQVLKSNGFDPQKEFILDSVTLVELVVLLEDQTDVFFNDNIDKLENAHTLKQLLSLIREEKRE